MSDLNKRVEALSSIGTGFTGGLDRTGAKVGLAFALFARGFHKEADLDDTGLECSSCWEQWPCQEVTLLDERITQLREKARPEIPA